MKIPRAPEQMTLLRIPPPNAPWMPHLPAPVTTPRPTTIPTPLEGEGEMFQECYTTSVTVTYAAHGGPHGDTSTESAIL